MIIVGVGGGSGSGKTYLCSKIREKLPDSTLVFSMDRYYRPFNDRDEFERKQINFDHPKTLDWELMEEHLEKLRNEETVQMPEYSYEKNTRTGHELKEPADLVLVEGIHAFRKDRINQLMDLKIFLDPEPDIRAVRRMKRDITQRDRNPEFAARQYIEKTRKAHEKHVEPTRQAADLILDHRETDRFIEKVTELLRQEKFSNIKQLDSFSQKD